MISNEAHSWIINATIKENLKIKKIIVHPGKRINFNCKRKLHKKESDCFQHDKRLGVNRSSRRNNGLWSIQEDQLIFQLCTILPENDDWHEVASKYFKGKTLDKLVCHASRLSRLVNQPQKFRPKWIDNIILNPNYNSILSFETIQEIDLFFASIGGIDNYQPTQNSPNQQSFKLVETIAVLNDNCDDVYFRPDHDENAYEKRPSKLRKSKIHAEQKQLISKFSPKMVSVNYLQLVWLMGKFYFRTNY